MLALDGHSRASLSLCLFGAPTALPGLGRAAALAADLKCGRYAITPPGERPVSRFLMVRCNDAAEQSGAVEPRQLLIPLPCAARAAVYALRAQCPGPEIGRAGWGARGGQ